MGVAERREREREQLRGLIVEAARDLLMEQGLSGLSMRSIAERVEYSPGTIYLYFRDKDELLREVVRTGFELLAEVVQAEQAALGAEADPAQRYGAMGRGYARFAVENPAYFRVMFELPGKPALECPEPGAGGDGGLADAVQMIREAVEEGRFGAVDPERTALVGWGLIHGLTALFLSGHLTHAVQTTEAFLGLIDDAMQSVYAGWKPAAMEAGGA
jgi:AcrR family transcriptional regulator